MRVLAAHETTSSMSAMATPCVGDGLLARLEGAVEQVLDQLLEFGARQLWRTRCLGPEASAVTKGRLIFSFDGCGQFDFGLFGGVPEPLRPSRCPWRRGPAPAPALNSAISHSTMRWSEIVAPKVGVAVGGLDFDDAFRRLQEWKWSKVPPAPRPEVVDGGWSRPSFCRGHRPARPQWAR